MEMCKVTEHHAKLAALSGTWKGEEKLYPSPWDAKGGSAVGRIAARLDLDGFFLISDYVEERDGRVTYKGHGIYGWNDAEKCYTMHWFDSMGGSTAAPARGKWEGNTLTFQQATPMGHSRYSYKLEGEGCYTFRIESSQDGASWTAFMEATYSRA